MTIDHDALARRIATAVATKSGFRPGPVLRKRLTNQGKLGRDQEFHCHETLVEAISTELREALPTSETSETGWLIERNRERGPEWAVFGDFGVEWTKDSTKACRFCRRDDAEQLAYGEDCDAVTEHTWS